MQVSEGLKNRRGSPGLTRPARWIFSKSYLLGLGAVRIPCQFPLPVQYHKAQLGTTRFSACSVRKPEVPYYCYDPWNVVLSKVFLILDYEFLEATDRALADFQ
eukprot:3012729-Rhodomonas_salina.1